MEDSRYAPIHPGEILVEEFMKPAGITIHDLASGSGLSKQYLHLLICGDRAVTRYTSKKLAHYFGLSTGFWLRLQKRYDEEKAKDAATILS